MLLELHFFGKDDNFSSVLRAFAMYHIKIVLISGKIRNELQVSKIHKRTILQIRSRN